MQSAQQHGLQLPQQDRLRMPRWLAAQTISLYSFLSCCPGQCPSSRSSSSSSSSSQQEQSGQPGPSPAARPPIIPARLIGYLYSFKSSNAWAWVANLGGASRTLVGRLILPSTLLFQAGAISGPWCRAVHEATQTLEEMGILCIFYTSNCCCCCPHRFLLARTSCNRM